MNSEYVLVSDVKQLCRDFSSRNGSVYIKDVEAQLDALAERSDLSDSPTIYDFDKLRFIQRVLESNAPESDKKAARDMAVDLRHLVWDSIRRLYMRDKLAVAHATNNVLHEEVANLKEKLATISKVE